ncbi:MAG: hypothetical protein M1150_00490 [Patescibacteria group bacterium]|nr:hypothetical protein [Patescibacteria group bacterium]
MSKKTKLFPHTIIEEINKRPPYQYGSVAESYSGLEVTWKLTFFTLDKKQDGKLLVTLRETEEFPSVLILSEVNESEYPELKTMNKGETVTINGIINTAKAYGSITLIKCKLSF